MRNRATSVKEPIVSTVTPLGVEVKLGLHTMGHQSVPKFLGVAVVDDPVVESMKEQRGRRPIAGEFDRLPVVRRIGARENRTQCVGIRIERIRPGQTHEPDDGMSAEPRPFEIPAVEREQCGNLRARRMSHEYDAVGIAAELARVLLHPGDRRGAIIDEPGKLDLRVESIIGNRRDVSTLRQSSSNERVFGLPSCRPRAAVEKDHDRAMVRVFRRVDVQVLAGIRSVSEIRTTLEGAECVGGIGHKEAEATAACEYGGRGSRRVFETRRPRLFSFIPTLVHRR